MADQTRRWVTLLAGLAIVAVVVLAAGLSDLDLAAGHLPAQLVMPTETYAGQERDLSQELLDAVMVVLAILTVLLVALLVVSLVFAADAKKRLLIALGLLSWLVVLYLVSQADPRPPEQAQQTASPSAATSLPATALPQGEPVPAIALDLHPPGWLVWLGAAAMALLGAGAMAGIAWFVWSRSHRRPTQLEELAQQADWALDMLEAGADLEDTILRCYFEMGQILKRQRGIVRQEAMTPREFERGLAGSGLPHEAVAQLTRLFERVRYGFGPPDERDERQAITCLAAIAEACRSTP